MGIAPGEIHTLGSVQHLKKGSSTGLMPVALKDTLEFLEDDIKERTGLEIKFPLDKEGADILLIHNAGEYLSWPENPMAFAIIFEAAGLNWTLSSDLLGYDAVNYGLWYDDVQFARVAVRHAQIAKKLGVKKIVIGECGHAHKAISVIADRIINEEINIPRESSMTLLEDLVCHGKLNLNPKKNDFPVTLPWPISKNHTLNGLSCSPDISSSPIPSPQGRGSCFWRIRYTSWVGKPVQASPLNPKDSAALTITSLRSLGLKGLAIKSKAPLLNDSRASSTVA